MTIIENCLEFETTPFPHTFPSWKSVLDTTSYHSLNQYCSQDRWFCYFDDMSLALMTIYRVIFLLKYLYWPLVGTITNTEVLFMTLKVLNLSSQSWETYSMCNVLPGRPVGDWHVLGDNKMKLTCIYFRWVRNIFVHLILC